MPTRDTRDHKKPALGRPDHESRLAAYLHRTVEEHGIARATWRLTAILVSISVLSTGTLYWAIGASTQYFLIGMGLAFCMTAAVTPPLAQMSFRRMRQLYTVNDALREAVARAEEADASKSQLLATVSHEIRSPLSGMLGLIELLEKRRNAPDSEDHLAVLKETGESMLHTLNDLLDHAKLEAGHIELEPEEIDLPRLLSRLALFWEGRCAEKNIAFDLDTGPDMPAFVVTDAHRLKQVLINLIGNAIKFTEAGSVTLTARAGENGDVLIEVTDTGIGMDEADLARAFTPFVQSGAGSAGKYGGTGLGLSICRSLAALMGGGLTLSSAPGKGTTAHLRLPLTRPSSHCKSGTKLHYV